MPTVYDLLPDEVKQLYPPELLNDRARSALTKQLPPGYPADRAAALAAKVAPLLPKLGRGWSKGPVPDVAMPNGNPFVESRGGGASWEDDPLASPDAVAHFRSANPVVRALAKAGEASAPFVAGIVNKLGAVGNAVVTARTGVDSPLPQMDPAGTRLPATKGFAENVGELVGGIAGFAGETAALTPFVGPTAALGLTAATPETTWKGAAVSAATTMLAGKAAGMAAEQLEPLLGAWKAAGVPGKIAAYVVSHMPGSAAFGALQPGAQAEVLRMTGENVQDPSAKESLLSSAKLLAASLVTGIPGAMRADAAETAAAERAQPSAELVAAMQHIRGGAIDPGESAREASMGVGVPPEHVQAVEAPRSTINSPAPLAATRYDTLEPAAPNTDMLPRTPEPRLAGQEAVAGAPVAPTKRPAPPTAPGAMPWDANRPAYPRGRAGAQAAAEEVGQVRDRLGAMAANEPKKSDKRYARWAQRTAALQGRHDELMALLKDRGATGLVEPEPVAPSKPETPKGPGPKLAPVTPIVAAKPAGAEAEASGARSEPAPAANVEAPATPIRTETIAGHEFRLERTPDGRGVITVTGPDGKPVMSDEHPTYEAAAAKLDAYVERGKALAAPAAAAPEAIAPPERPGAAPLEQGTLQTAAERGAVDPHAAAQMVDDGEFGSASDLGRLTGLFADGHAASLPTLRSAWDHLGFGIRTVNGAHDIVDPGDIQGGDEIRETNREYLEKAKAIEDELETFDGTNAREVGERIHDIILPTSPEAIDRLAAAGELDPWGAAQALAFGGSRAPRVRGNRAPRVRTNLLDEAESDITFSTQRQPSDEFDVAELRRNITTAIQNHGLTPKEAAALWKRYGTEAAWRTEGRGTEGERRLRSQSTDAQARRGLAPAPRLLEALPAQADLPTEELPEGYAGEHPQTVSGKIAAAPKRVVEFFKKLTHDVVAGFDPGSMAKGIPFDLFNAARGRLAAEDWETHHNQRGTETWCRGNSKRAVMRMARCLETGERDASTARLVDMWNDRMENLFDAVLRFRPDLPYIENYFVHPWATGNETDRVDFSRVPVEGRAYYLKTRFFGSWREALASEKDPKTWNIERMVQDAEHNLRKKIMYLGLRVDANRADGFQFLPSGRQMPKGTVETGRHSDVYLPPKMTVKEWRSLAAVQALKNVGNAIGARMGRVATMPKGTKAPGDVLGVRVGPEGEAGTVLTRFGTPDDVMAHEVGHAMDAKFGMKAVLWEGASPTIRREMRALALERVGPDASANFRRYVQGASEKMALLVQAHIAMPEKFKRIAPKTYEKYMGFLGAHAELKPLLDYEPSLQYEQSETEINTPGMMIAGKWIAQEDFGRVINNHESLDHIGSSAWGKTAMLSRNFHIAMKLGLSAMHATLVTRLAGAHAASQMDLRDPAAALRRLTGVIPIVNTSAAVKYLSEGRKMIAEGISNEGLRNFYMGGGRLELPTDAKLGVYDSFLNYTKQATAPGTPLGERGKSVGQAAIRAPFFAVIAPMQAIAKNYTNPIKVAAFQDQFATQLLMRADDIAAGRLTKEDLAFTTVNNINNLFGLVSYDNYMWNRTLRTAMQLSLTALGWNRGDLAIYTGAAKDAIKVPTDFKQGKKMHFTPRMATFLAVAVEGVAFRATYHWLHTGKPPQEWQDFIMPQTGLRGAGGKPERLSVKDYPGDAVGWFMDPAGTAFNKLAPDPQLLSMAMTNWATRSKNKSLWKKQTVEDAMNAIWASYSPITVQQNFPKGKSAPNIEQRIEGGLGMRRVSPKGAGGSSTTTTTSVPYHRPSYYYRKASQGDK